MSSQESDTKGTDLPPALTRLLTCVLAHRQAYPEQLLPQLKAELAAALERTETAEPERLTVMNPSSRPVTMKLSVLLSDAGLDTMYSQESAELAVSDSGLLYLVYRRSASGDYAIEWSPATTLPLTMMHNLSPALAAALVETDADEP